MIRTLILASAMALGAGAAQAAPQLIGGGNDSTVVYSEVSQNVVGGGSVQLSGGNDDRSFGYGAVQAQPGRAVSFQGGDLDRRFIEVKPGKPVTLAQSLVGRTRG